MYKRDLLWINDPHSENFMESELKIFKLGSFINFTALFLKARKCCVWWLIQIWSQTLGINTKCYP